MRLGLFAILSHVFWLKFCWHLSSPQIMLHVLSTTNTYRVLETLTMIFWAVRHYSSDRQPYVSHLQGKSKVISSLESVAEKYGRVRCRNSSQMSANLSVLRTDRSLLSDRFLVLICVRGWFDSSAIMRLERLSNLEGNYNDVIGTKTSDLTSCRAGPQQTMLYLCSTINTVRHSSAGD